MSIIPATHRCQGDDGRADLFARVRGESKVQKDLIATQIDGQHFHRSQDKTEG